jgi:hypothetical protein
MDKTIAKKKPMQAPHIGSCVGKIWIAMINTRNEMTPTRLYHHVGTSEYALIKREWTSGSSFSVSRNLRMILWLNQTAKVRHEPWVVLTDVYGIPKVWTRTDANAANDTPYPMHKVAEM